MRWLKFFRKPTHQEIIMAVADTLVGLKTEVDAAVAKIGSTNGLTAQVADLEGKLAAAALAEAANEATIASLTAELHAANNPAPAP